MELTAGVVIFFGTLATVLVYICVRVLLANTSGASESRWRDITVIDIAILLALIAAFVTLP